MTTPRPIDARGPRFHQGVLAAVLTVGFLADVWAVAPVCAVASCTGAVFGVRHGLLYRCFTGLIGPRLAPPIELADPRPARFAASVSATLLVAATAAFTGGVEALGWALVGLVAVLGGLAAATGLCVGCELFTLIARRRGIALLAQDTP